MFKTIAIAALGFAAVSAQFLEERNLQDAATVAFTAAPAVSATGAETGCNTAGYALVTNTRTGTAVTVPANICVPTDFVGQSLTIAGTTYAFTKIASNVVAVNRTVCTSDDACAVGECCADITLAAGPAATSGTATTKFCTAGTAATLYSSTYAAPSWLANYAASVKSAVCTPKVAPVESFGSYIKASVMMVVAVLSVALF
jgi:hypothetical protein